MFTWSRSVRSVCVALAVIILGATPILAAPAYVPGEVIVKFRQGTPRATIDAVRADLGGVVKTELAFTGATCLRLNAMSVEDAIAKYQGNRVIEYIEPNYLWNADVIPNDTHFNDLWGMHNIGQTGGTSDADIDAPAAWDSETGTAGVLVAVIDTGVDYWHPDLAANIWTNPGEIAGNGLDDDLNGFIDDIHGYDFVNGDGDPMDDYGHGTHCSGTIGAIGNNGTGVVGVCWQVQIMGVKFLDASGGGNTEDAISSVGYAVQMGADILSNSWGGITYSAALRDAIAVAGAAGVVFVASAGNASSNNDVYPRYPASYDLDNIIAVAATDHDDLLAGFSCWGPTTVDLGAPGVSILSTMPGASYEYKDGTSMACPHVSGAIALLMARFPGITGAAARTLVFNTVDPLPGLQGLVMAGGRLNVEAAMAGPDSIPPGPIVDLATATTSGQWVDLTWTATGDDGSDGTASVYELRFATFPIDSLNFETATLATGIPLPQAAGTPETARVSGLEFETDYWFAIRARDEYGLPSPVVNAVMTTTGPPPVITVTPASLSSTLYPGGVETQTLTIGNTGQSDLAWSAAVNLVDEIVGRMRGTTFTIRDYPRRSPEPPAGKLNGGGSPSLPFGKRVYISDRQLRVEPRILLLASFEPNNDAYGLALQHLGLGYTMVTDWWELEDALSTDGPWDLVIVNSYSNAAPTSTLGALENHLDNDGALIFADWSVYQYTGHSLLTRLGVSFQASFWTPLDMAAVDPSHRCFQWPNEVSEFHWSSNQYEIDGQIVGVLAGARQLAAFAGDPNSGAIVLDATEHAIFNGFQASNFTADDDGDGLRDIVELAENEIVLVGLGAPWLTVEPSEGVVAAGATQDVTVTFDATGLCGGEFAAQVAVTSNDPITPEVSVPASLDVIGESDITVTPASLAYGPQYIGAVVPDTLTVTNDGCELLTVSGVTSDNLEFTVLPAGPFTLAPDASQVVVVTYAPATVGPVTGC